MNLYKTQFESLTTEQIEQYIKAHEANALPRLDRLKAYYAGKNQKILARQAPDASNPDNKTPVPYARKIITTLVGCGFRPGYTTYASKDEAFLKALLDIFQKNNESAKTTITLKNMATYGEAYELCYFDDEAKFRFMNIEPQEMILLYDYATEPAPNIGIRYYQMSDDGKKYRVEVYTADFVTLYDRTKSEKGEWVYMLIDTDANTMKQVPIIPYYSGDDRLGVFEPVIPMIDDYDLLMSDSMNEFDRFAAAYLILKKMFLVDPEAKKDPFKYSQALNFLKRRRVFENVPDTGDVKFLTKDIPTAFIQEMFRILDAQIHKQSHVPDFSAQTGLSGDAVERLIFDFENLASSLEASLNAGLMTRIGLIASLMGNRDALWTVTIAHKRNLPKSLEMFTSAALKMKQAGFSARSIADLMPDDIIADVDKELAEQESERQSMAPDIETMPIEEPEMNQNADESTDPNDGN